jgi:protein ERP2
MTYTKLLLQAVLVTALLFFTCHCTKNIRHFTYTFEVEDNQEFCLYHQFNHSAEYLVEFGVLRGGNLDINFYLEAAAEGGSRLHTEVGTKKTNSYSFTTSAGVDYRFCFDNQFSSITHKVVYFGLRPANERRGENLHEEAAADNETALPYVMTKHEFMLNMIHFFMNNVSDIQTYYRREELIDREFAEQISARVQIFSGMNLCAIVCTTLAQAYVVRQFFKNRNSGGNLNSKH